MAHKFEFDLPSPIVVCIFAVVATTFKFNYSSFNIMHEVQHRDGPKHSESRHRPLYDDNISHLLGMRCNFTPPFAIFWFRDPAHVVKR